MQVRVTDFSTTPGGGYRSQGPHSGEEFREEHLKPALDSAEHGGWHVDVDMRGTEFGASVGFLKEAFGGLVRERGREAIAGRLRITGDKCVDPTEIERLMAEGEWNAGTRERYSKLLNKYPQPAPGIWDTLVYAAEAGDAIQWIQHDNFPRRTDAAGALYLASLHQEHGVRSARFRSRENEIMRIDERSLPVLHGAVVAHCVDRTRRRLRWKPTTGGARQAGTELVTRLHSTDGRWFDLVCVEEAAVELWSVDRATGTLEKTTVNDATRDALWTIADAAGLVPGYVHEADAEGRREPVDVQSTNGHVPRRVRRRLQKWAEQIAAWHAAWLVLRDGNGHQPGMPTAYELGQRGLSHTREHEVETVTHRRPGKVDSVWTSPGEVCQTALRSVFGTSARAYEWRPLSDNRIEPEQMQVVLADAEVNAEELVIEARLAGGNPLNSSARLVDRSSRHQTVEWESPEENWKGGGEQEGLGWLAAMAAGHARKTSTATRAEDA